MKKAFIGILVLLFAGIATLLSCSKEYSCEGCLPVKRTPIARAGADQIVNLPTDSTKLDGSTSYDPDGTISSFHWTKVSGPASLLISNNSAAKTPVKNLVVGVYLFELAIIDNDGFSARDTVQVMVKDPSQANRPPVANAGPDQIINPPSNSTILNGSNSTDPDNNISSYKWTKISGPSSFTLVNANVVQTQVSGLDLGVYQFELKVTDAGGLSSKDTMKVTVLAQAITCNLRLIPVGMLSTPRYGMTTASVGNKILFAGGVPYSTGTGRRVDIYDMGSQTWSTAELSGPKEYISAATVGHLVFFAGGQTESSRIDIYDANNDTWSTDELSEARSDLVVAAAGNKVLFAGGNNANGLSDMVEIYDVSTNSWSYSQLSVARHSISATAYGTKIYFSGGNDGPGYSPSDAVDIYDAVSDSWSATTLSERKLHHANIGVDGKIFWIGGFNGGLSCSLKVEMFDVTTGVHTFHSFSQSSCYPLTGTINNKIVFFTQDGAFNVEVFDRTTQSWSFCNLTYNSLKAVANANNSIYCVQTTLDANGNLASQVLKLEN
ncbi:MAG TPA: PKD domain-containing protein [Chitinophagaceae bacterium]|nr:PKD domain-containing protein [Chitinophagaceae bacterium]